MFALGHKQTSAPDPQMSALRQKRTRFSLYRASPRVRTQSAPDLDEDCEWER